MLGLPWPVNVRCTSASSNGLFVKAAFGSAICSGSLSNTTLPTKSTFSSSNGLTMVHFMPAASNASLLSIAGRLNMKPTERSPPSTSGGQVQAHGHLGRALVGAVAHPEPAADTLGRVEAIDVHALVEVRLGAELVHVFVGFVQSYCHGRHGRGNRLRPSCQSTYHRRYIGVAVMLITGASRGIGAATAVLAAAEGYDVAVNYARDARAADAVVDACQAVGSDAFAVCADVSDEAAVVEMFDRVVERHGAIDVLVNNAGILHQQMRFDEMSTARWRELLEVNVIGAFTCAREAVLRMSTRYGGHGGAIVNVSSAAAYIGSPGGVRRLRGEQGGDRHAHARSRQGGGSRGRPGQRRAPRRDPHRHPCIRR